MTTKKPVWRNFSMKKNKLIPKCQIGKQLPTAPKVQDRYKNSKRYQYNADGSIVYSPSHPLFTSVLVSGVQTDFPFQTNQAEIERRIYYTLNSPTDTVYTEIPNSILPVKRIMRTANSKNKTSEYQTLRKRFNMAWNLAK